MRERFVIESGWQLNQIFWFGSKNTALPFLLSLPLQPANGEYPRTLPEYDNFYDDLMTIKTLYDDEKIAMMMLARWWWFFHSFPTDWSMQTKKDQSSKVRFPHSEIDQNLISRSLGGAGGQKRSVHFGRNTETQSRNTRNTPKYPSHSSGSF